jgi:hypothetical protein
MSSNWSEAQRAEIERRLGAGESPTDIARLMGLRRESIRQHGKVRAASSRENARTPVGKPKYRGVPWGWQKRAEEPELHTSVEPDEAIRVCVIGDLHVSPGQDLSRLKWIARHIGETQPDRIVQIGDWASFDSVSTHDPIGSLKAKIRPSLREDVDCLRESLALFARELGPGAFFKTLTLGNHEDRVRRYQDLRAELDDSIWSDVLGIFAQYGWKTHDFGKVTFIGGVGFVHVPLNVIGKPHSSPNIMGNNLAHDLVKGHSHRATYQTFSKIGEDRGVMLIDVGTSLAHGHVENYAKLSQTGWYWGLHDVTIRNGRIDDFARVSMRTLEARYA